METPSALAFELFFEAERRRLFRALYLMSGSVHEAEELVQDGFLKLRERWDRVSAMEDPVGYLYRVAMNLARMRATSRRRLPPLAPSYGASRDPSRSARDDVNEGSINPA